MLDIYKIATGQSINKSKIGVFFNTNTNPVVKGQILNSAGVSLYNNQEKYLGLSMMVGRNIYRTFEAIKDKVWTRLNN